MFVPFLTEVRVGHQEDEEAAGSSSPRGIAAHETSFEMRDVKDTPRDNGE